MLMAILFASPALAETILLKDGSRLTGTIISADPDSVRFKTPDGVLTIRRERIQSIDYGSEPVAPQATPVPAAQAPPSAPATVATAESNGSSFHFILEPGYRFAISEAEGGFSGDVAAMSRVSPEVSVGVSVGLAHFNNKVNTLSDGSVTVVPLMVRSVARTRDGLSFEAGLGYALSSHNLSDDAKAAYAFLGLSGEEDVEAAFVGEIAFGYTSAPRNAFSGGIFIGYQVHHPDVTFNFTDLVSGGTATVSSDISLSAPFVRAFFSF